MSNSNHSHFKLSSYVVAIVSSYQSLAMCIDLETHSVELRLMECLSVKCINTATMWFTLMCDCSHDTGSKEAWRAWSAQAPHTPAPPSQTASAILRGHWASSKTTPPTSWIQLQAERFCYSHNASNNIFKICVYFHLCIQ